MSILTENIITEKDRIDYIKVQIQRNILLPFNPKLFAEVKYWVEQLHEEKQDFMNLIWRWFYEQRLDKERIRTSN